MAGEISWLGAPKIAIFVGLLGVIADARRDRREYLRSKADISRVLPLTVVCAAQVGMLHLSGVNPTPHPLPLKEICQSGGRFAAGHF